MLKPSSPDRYVALAFDTGLIALGMTMVLLVVIVCLRLRLRHTDRRENLFIARWRPLLMGAIAEPDLPALPVLHRRDHVYFLQMWNYLQESLRGSAGDRLNAVARQLHCDEAARQLLQTGSRAERLLATLTLGHLRDQHSWAALAALALSADRLASLQAARAMVKIDPLMATEYLLPQLLTRSDWDLTQLASFLSDARQALWLLLTKNILDHDEAHWPRALQLIVALRLELPASVMRTMLQRCASAETLILALHAASDLSLLSAVRRYQTHPDWRARAEVANFLRRFGQTEDIPVLQRLLQDPQWWVRYRAAQALASLPSIGRNALLAWRATAPDTLGKAMLDHVLAESSQSTDNTDLAVG